MLYCLVPSLTGGSGRCALFLLRSVSITKPHRAPTHTHILTQSMIHQSLHSMEVHTKVEIRIWKIKSMYSRVPNKHVALLFYFRKFFPLTISHNKQILFSPTKIFKNVPTYMFILPLRIFGTLEYIVTFLFIRINCVL